MESSPATSPRIQLLSRPGCHLCGDARAVVERVARDLGEGFVEIDVDARPALRARYSDLVPVVLVDGREHAYWRIDAERLRAALA